MGAKRLFELLIPRRPLSHQTGSRPRLQAWKSYVTGLASQVWGQRPTLTDVQLRVTLVYLCDLSAGDVDNIIKPIQDALVGVVFRDDLLVADVDCHRRYMSDGIDLTNLPPLLIEGAFTGAECVYVAVSYSEPRLEGYL